MFQLEGHFRSLLRDAAIFEGVGKLISLADAHQELRLREELFAPACRLARSRGEGSEIDVGGQVLLAGSLVGVGLAECWRYAISVPRRRPASCSLRV